MDFASSCKDAAICADVSEIEDEFLFQSIQRYNTLQMFNLENIPYHLLQMDDVTLCIGSKRLKKENSELLNLKLPEKLSLPPEDEGRSKENDFKVLSSIYTKNLLYQIDNIKNYGKIITSECSVRGLVIYSFSDNSVGKEAQGSVLNVAPWNTPDFAPVPESTSIICSKCCHSSLIQADIASETIVREIEHPFLTLNIIPKNWSGKIDPCCENNIKCSAISSDLIAILSTHSGEVILHDLRTKDLFIALPATSKKQGKEIWTISGCDYKESSFDLFGILSNKSSFCIYDKRNNSILFEQAGENQPKENYSRMKLKFNNKSDHFSISGVNCNVEIFKIKGTEFEHFFTHVGHCPAGSPFVVTTDHIWLQTGGNEYIVSICDNGTLNCWNYKDKFLLQNTKVSA